MARPSAQTAAIPGPGATELRGNYLTPVEGMAQVLGFMTPTGVLGVTIPLMIIHAGTGTGTLFLLTLVIFALISFNINIFASRCVSAGSLATFIRMGLGPRTGVLAGWAYLLGMGFSAAIAAAGSAEYLDLALSQISGGASTIFRVFLFILVVLGAAWWTAYRDVKLSTDVMLYIETGSILIMVGMLGWILRSSGAWVDHTQFSKAALHPGEFQSGLVFAFTCLAGFESGITLGEESKEATRVIPRIMIACVMLLGLFFYLVSYLLVSLAHHGVLAPGDLDNPFIAIARQLHLPALGIASSLGVALSFFACALASINAGSRILYSLARDGNVWPLFAALHPLNATPHRAVAGFALFCSALAGGLLIASGSVDAAIDYLSQLSCLAFLTTYVLIGVAAIAFQRRQGDLRGPSLAVSLLSLAAVLMLLCFDLYPIQPAPGRYYLFIFVAFLAIGMLISTLRPWLSAKRQPLPSSA